VVSEARLTAASVSAGVTVSVFENLAAQPVTAAKTTANAHVVHKVAFIPLSMTDPPSGVFALYTDEAFKMLHFSRNTD
jgi:hypothetical protein